MRSVVEEKAKIIQTNLSEKLYTVNNIEFMLNVSNYDADTFDSWAPYILKPDSEIECIQLAPDGVIEKIYPLQGHEAALGHNILNDEKRSAGAHQALNSKGISLIGPLNLIQNNKKALICRKAIFSSHETSEDFWGFAVLIIYLESLGMDEILGDDHCCYRIIGYNPDSDSVPIIYEDVREDYDTLVEYPIFLPGASWKLQLFYKTDSVYGNFHIALHIIFLLLGIIYLNQYFKLFSQSKRIQRLNVELESLTYTDDLTGLHNRRGIYRVLEELIRTPKPVFTIAIMDLNSFKIINDTYGHNIGDEALKHLAKVLKTSFGNDNYIGRTGGDEFLCIFNNMPPFAVNMLLDNFHINLSDSPLIYNGVSLPISTSVGVEHWHNCTTLEELIEKADMAMYKYKRMQKGTVH